MKTGVLRSELGLGLGLAATLLLSTLSYEPLAHGALAPGAPAPQFSARNQDGKTIQLSDLKGKYVLLYFYPKDDTLGCTQEACAFRDEFSQFSKFNAVVFGVSRQDEKSHQKFRSKHKLPFDLLVDSDGSLAEKFQIGSFPLVGSLLGLTKRKSVLIGPDGEILKTYDDVDPKNHARQVLKDIQEYRNR